MIDKSFQLLRTNPRLTTNIKLLVSSDDKLYLESFDTNKQLNDVKYKHIPVNKDALYEYELIKFYDGLPIQLAFDVKFDNDTQIVYTTYDKQFDDLYWSGAKYIEDKWHGEDFEYFAPLYIKKRKLPDGFVVLRVDEPTPYEEINNQFDISKLTRDNFNYQIVDKWKCVNFFDMRYETNVGYFLSKNIIENDRFPLNPLEIDFRKYEFSRYYGIDYYNGVYSIKSKFLRNVLKLEQPHFRLEKEITNGFRDNGLVFANILNFKFLFNDRPATPDDFRDYSMNRYYGFYIDDLELIQNVTSYISPGIKSGVTLINNVFIKDGEEMTVTPFSVKWNSNKRHYIFWNDKFNEVVKVLENGKYIYKILSTDDLSDIDFTKINDNACFISYQSGNYKCMSYENPSGYTNFVSGFTGGFAIDPYVVSDPVGLTWETKTMYADLYLIKIDGIYHVLRKRGNSYFIQSDYAINSYPGHLEYWKGGRQNSIYKPIETIDSPPLTYSIYRLKFSDIKDFDFDRIDTKFADFDYEKDKYYVTEEQKLYAVDYLNSTIGIEYKIHPKGEDGQYQIMNVSSEYVSDDELYEILNGDLTEIWRKNPYICKWGYAGSNSNCDYPYKLNNSILIGDIFNRTTDIFEIKPNEPYKNMDFFYRIGNLINRSGDTLRYYNQSIHIETDLMNQNFSERFNLDMYFNADVDYFDYFFKNKMYYSWNGSDYIKSTQKYSTFEGGDNYNRSTTLFKGIEYKVQGVENLIRSDDSSIESIITNRKEFNGYKFSVIFNDVYMYYKPNAKPAQFIRKYPNGVSGNTIFDDEVNGLHIFLNEKFKNILIILNSVIPFNSGNTSLNNVDVYGERHGLYYAESLTDAPLIGNIGVDRYASTWSAGNFIQAIDDLNHPYCFETGVTYYYINSDGLSGSTGPMNIYNSGNTMSKIIGWSNDFPPFIITTQLPQELKTKRNSYIKNAIKGPQTNIYDKYMTFYNPLLKKDETITEPLAREIRVNELANTNNEIGYGGVVLDDNLIYRYNGKYEPIFKDIQVFEPNFIYNSMDSGYTEYNYNYWSGNYKFGYTFTKFGQIDEVVSSKVNPTTNPLKLKNSTSDKSIYPMIDEFGYTFSSRFIFSSNWDDNFYTITKPDQVKLSKKIAFQSTQHQINPPEVK